MHRILVSCGHVLSLYIPQLLLMKAKPLITVSFFLLLFFACKKDNVDFQYNATYYKSAIDRSILVSYYTNKGEITNISVINKYYSEDTSRFSYLFRYAMERGYYDTLIVPKPDEVIVNTYGRPESFHARKEGTRMIFTKDSIISYSSPDEYSKNPGFYLLQYKPRIYSEWIANSTRGEYLFGYQGERVNVISTDGERIIFPLFVYQQRREGKYPRSDYINNYLKKDFWKDIMPGDTLSILESNIYYKKK